MRRIAGSGNIAANSGLLLTSIAGVPIHSFPPLTAFRDDHPGIERTPAPVAQ
jgi:hypothetical protein